MAHQAHGLLKEVRAGYRGRAVIDYSRLRKRLAVAVQSLPDADPRGVEAITRCFGLKGPPECQEGVRRSLRGGPISRRTLQYLMRSTIARLDEALETGTQHGEDTTGGRWPGLRVLKAASPSYQERVARALERAEALVPGDEVVGARARLSLRCALDQLRADLSGRQGPDAYGGRSLTPALRWRLRLVAWNAVLCVDPFIPGANVAPVSVGPFRDSQPIDRRSVTDRLHERLLGGRVSADEVEEALTAAIEIYPLDTVRATGLVHSVKRHLRDAAPSLQAELNERLAGFELTEACHKAIPEPDVRRRFKRLMEMTKAQPGSGVRLGGVLDFSTYLGNTSPERAYESIDLLRGLRIEINSALPERRESLFRYFNLRSATAKTTVAGSTGDRGWLDSACQDLSALEADGDLPPATALDLARNLSSIDATRAQLLDRDGRFDEAERVAERGARRLEGARRVAEPLMTARQGSEPWYRQKNLVTGGYRPGIRHLLNEIDLRVRLDDEAAVRALLTSATIAWNDDPTIGIFYGALGMIALSAADTFGIDLPVLAPPVLGLSAGGSRLMAHTELTILTQHGHPRTPGGWKRRQPDHEGHASRSAEARPDRPH